MRLFLLPIAPGRTLLFCKRIHPLSSSSSSQSQSHSPSQQQPPPPPSPTWHDKLQHKTAAKWSEWERADRGWKKHLVRWGDSVMQRVPFEEWGLKSVPPLSRKRRAEMLRSLKGDGHEGECGGMEKGMGSTTRTSLLVDLLYPKNVIPSTRVLPELSRLATERQQLHRSRMWWSIAMTPLTIPIAIIPLIPNIPFFYLAYRAWSHWRALEGSKHLAFLLDNKLVAPNSHAALERLYHDNHTVVTGREKEKGMPFGDEDEEEAVTTTKIRTPAEEEHEPGLSKEERAAGAAAAARASAGGKEAYLQDRAILLRSSDGRKIADVLDAPELTGEIERAVYQVRHLKLSAQGTRERR